MKINKFSMKELLLDSCCGLFCIEVNNSQEYKLVRRATSSVDSELVKKWDVSVNKTGFPTYINKMGQSMSKNYAQQHDYRIVMVCELDISPEDYVSYNLSKLQTSRKERFIEFLNMLLEEEARDTYFFLTDTGEIASDTETDNKEVAQQRKRIGNYFDTKEDAERELEKRIQVTKWKKIQHRLNNNCVVQQDPNYYYHPVYNSKTDFVSVGVTQVHVSACGTHFGSESMCRQAMNELGIDNVKKFILEVDTDATNREKISES